MKYLFTTQLSVSTLIDQFKEGLIAIPEIQRDVVWSSEQVKELFDSINQNYPCGSLILWEPRLKDEQLMREIIRPERLEYYEGRLPKYFLIDGQQRITALASVLLDQGFLQKLEPELEDQIDALYANLKSFPADIEAVSDSGQYKFPWVLMNDIFNGRLKEFDDYKKLPATKRQDIDKYVQRIKDYQFPVQIIQERDYATVGQIFARVNSQGTQLTGAEIHIASIIPHWRGISAEFRKYRHDLRQAGYDLDLTFLMRAITVLACNVPQIKKLADKVAEQKLERKELNKYWTRSKKASDRVIKTLRDTLLLDRTKFFPSKNALVPLVYYVDKAGKKPRSKKMAKFFLATQLGGHYSGAGETVLRRDLKYLSQPDVSPHEGLDSLLDVTVKEAKQEYRGLKVKGGDVFGPPSRNAMLLLTYIVMRNAGATDFGTSKPRRLDDIPSNEMQLHHIFPFDFMMKDENALKYRRARGLPLSEYRAEVNDIANITFLSRHRNAAIGNVAPWQYFTNETTKEIRKAHFIPEDSALWAPEKFNEFLEERARMLAGAMNSLIKTLN